VHKGIIAVQLAIIGAGISGLACADRLRESGIDAVMFDKARGPGGRMSTRRIETARGTVALDHGAQYFTARDPMFQAQVDIWAESGIVARWDELGADAWVGSPAMNAPVRHMASAHEVHFGHHVHGLLRERDLWWIRFEGGLKGPFDGVVVALPAEQAAPCLALADLAMASEAMSARSQPCWTAMIIFDGPLAVSANHIRDSGPIAWACRNSAKPGRDGPETWVVQASGAWSSAHLEAEPDDIGRRLLQALQQHCTAETLPPVLNLSAHRWRFAMTSGTDKGALWNPALKLGACGDWLLGPRVELAWLSGRRLGAWIATEDKGAAIGFHGGGPLA